MYNDKESGNPLIFLVCAMHLHFSKNRTATFIELTAIAPAVPQNSFLWRRHRIEPQSNIDHGSAFCRCATDTSRNSRFSASISTDGRQRTLVHHCKISEGTSERLWGIRHASQFLVTSWKCLLTGQTVVTKFILFKPQVSGSKLS